ncbi:hypothetical protein FEM48_Zijuj04G0120500 [Ziziphus jujuba var. spinosa]|uniref:Disease resistance protein At4g27190-like leucine-rich repeats domain-containing protein n=2 Tax=Ziziphus jujuba var. spinosa TaxID=714518 RepID=A0A978VJS1_ZIZJJ|nr:hypothetical protein FEM48_Zijuj04G0120500 [Ziziphus jujuba var. spinosa]
MANSFVHLRALGVRNCKLLKKIVVTEESGDGIRSQKSCFPALKILHLFKLPNLEKFYAGDHIECLFLEALKIKNCPKINTFVSNSTDKAVPEETNMISGARQPLFSNQKVTLPKLRILTLEICNSVIEIWDDYDTKDRGQQSAAAAGRSRSAIFQSLEFLRISKCGRLNKLLEANSSSSFENLTVLEVSDCERMEYLFTPSAAKTLVLLKKMGASKCQAMTEIIASSPEVDHDDKLLSFDNLELLVLESLPSLTSFYMGNCTLEFPKLSRVVVVGSCPELWSFCGQGTITTPKLRTFVRRTSRKRRWIRLDAWLRGC